METTSWPKVGHTSVIALLFIMIVCIVFVYCFTGAAAVVASIVHDGFMNPVEGEESQLCDFVPCVDIVVGYLCIHKFEWVIDL